MIDYIYGIIIMSIIDGMCLKKYKAPSLSLIIAKCFYSKHFKWLTYNIWGNDEWLYKIIIREMNINTKKELS